MERVDWFRVITNLSRAGMSSKQIGKEVGKNGRTVNYWKNGICEPRYSEGAQLLAVYRSVIGST